MYFGDADPQTLVPRHLESSKVYEGEFVNGVMTGKGLIIFPNGDKYEGYVVDAVPHGDGRLLFTDGSQIIGQFD